jgi:hypothetical protein
MSFRSLSHRYRRAEPSLWKIRFLSPLRFIEVIATIRLEIVVLEVVANLKLD